MQSQEIMKYSFNGVDFPVLGTAEEPLFDANMVCEILGFGNHHQALSSHVEEDDLQKMEGVVKTGTKADGTTYEQMGQKNYLTESGLFSLILGSKKPEAKEFKRWVTKDLLPSIRKNGGYGVAQAPTNSLPDPSAVKRTREIGKALGYRGHDLIIFVDNVVRKELGFDIAQYRPPETLSQLPIPVIPFCGYYLTPTQIGKRLDGLSGIAVNRRLEAMGYQFRNPENKWALTEAGKEFGKIDDTEKAYCVGTVQQLTWHESIVERLRKEVSA